MTFRGKPIILIAGVLVAVLIVAGSVHLLSMDGLQGFLLSTFCCSDTTTFSVKYSDKGFNRIHAGMSARQVEESLGDPIEKFVMQRGNNQADWLYRVGDGRFSGWSYSKSRSDSHYRIRVVVFEGDKVVDVLKGFYVD